MTSLLSELLFETSGQAPSPSKDFYHLAVTRTEVIWRWWKITLRMKNLALPGERKQSHEDFANDARLQQQVGVVFGTQILEYILNLCEGKFDYLERLSDKILLHVLSYLSYKDICQLSQTSHRFNKLCESKELWEQAIRDSGHELTPEVEMMANLCGWRKIYTSFYLTPAQHSTEEDEEDEEEEAELH
ncbi:F-box only protein 36-like isoform X1 [Tachysurus ichikawai]